MSWSEVLADHWLAKSVVVHGEPDMITVEAAYPAAVGACEPFTRGMRFHALPAIRLSVDDARILAPRDYLPRTGEPAEQYLARLGEAGDGRALTVTEPFFPNYALWTRLRAALAELWRRVGYPVLPVRTELTIATGQCGEEFGASNEATVAWVLGGAATVVTASGDELRLVAGDVLHLPPAANRFAVRDADSLLLLHIGVRLDRRAPVAELLDLVVAAVEPHDHDIPVPYVPSPPVAGEVDPKRHAVPVVVAADQIDAVELEREQAITWLGRVSAACLEPVPRPREEELAATATIRLREEIYTMPDPRGGRTLWAINGHAFSVAGAVPEQVRQRLMAAASVPVESLCRTENGTDNGALPLVQRLYMVRAIEIVGSGAA